MQNPQNVGFTPPGAGAGGTGSGRTIITGPNNSLLVYQGTPGPNNLIGSWSPVAFTDDFGNQVLAGLASYNLDSAVVTTPDGQVYYRNSVAGTQSGAWNQVNGPLAFAIYRAPLTVPGLTSTPVNITGPFILSPGLRYGFRGSILITDASYTGSITISFAVTGAVPATGFNVLFWAYDTNQTNVQQIVSPPLFARGSSQNINQNSFVLTFPSLLNQATASSAGASFQSAYTALWFDGNIINGSANNTFTLTAAASPATGGSLAAGPTGLTVVPGSYFDVWRATPPPTIPI